MGAETEVAVAELRRCANLLFKWRNMSPADIMKKMSTALVLQLASSHGPETWETRRQIRNSGLADGLRMVALSL